MGAQIDLGIVESKSKLRRYIHVVLDNMPSLIESP